MKSFDKLKALTAREAKAEEAQRERVALEIDAGERRHGFNGEVESCILVGLVMKGAVWPRNSV